MEHRETFYQEQNHHHKKETRHSAIIGKFFQQSPWTAQRLRDPHPLHLRTVCPGEQGKAELELRARELRGQAWGQSWTHALQDQARLSTINSQVDPTINNFRFISVPLYS